MRIACAYEYTICTTKDGDPFNTAKFEAVCNSLQQFNPPATIEQLLRIIKCFRIAPGLEGRKELSDTVDQLVDQFHFDEQDTSEKIYQKLGNTEPFIRTAALYVGADYNWFKHRPMRYSGAGRARERPVVQYALALRAYCSLCDLYSWCRGLRSMNTSQ